MEFCRWSIAMTALPHLLSAEDIMELQADKAGKKTVIRHKKANPGRRKALIGR